MQPRNASAFDHNLSRCVRRNDYHEPVDGEKGRTLSALFGEYADRGIELVPLEVAPFYNYGYHSSILFAADEGRGVNNVTYLCTLSVTNAAKRLGLRRYGERYL